MEDFTSGKKFAFGNGCTARVSSLPLHALHAHPGRTGAPIPAAVASVVLAVSSSLTNRLDLPGLLCSIRPAQCSSKIFSPTPLYYTSLSSSCKTLFQLG